MFVEYSSQGSQFATSSFPGSSSLVATLHKRVPAVPKQCRLSFLRVHPQAPALRGPMLIFPSIHHFVAPWVEVAASLQTDNSYCRGLQKSLHTHLIHPSQTLCKQTSQQDLVTTCVTDCFAIYNQKQNKETTQKYRFIWNPDFLWRSMRSWPSAIHGRKEINATKFPQNIYWKECSNVCCREWKENPTGFTLASQETWAQAVSNGRCRS